MTIGEAQSPRSSESVPDTGGPAGSAGAGDVVVPSGSFMGVPWGWPDAGPAAGAGPRAAVMGMPFDCGTHATRIGARQGPDAIRVQSGLVRPFQPPHADYNPLERLAVVDCGNVQVTHLGDSPLGASRMVWASRGASNSRVRSAWPADSSR